MNNKLLITKASGTKVPFSEEKLRSSLHRAGADESIIDCVLNELTPQLYEGISTKKIYKLASRALFKKSHPLAAKYHLKQAIMQLGPSGFPFENFIGELLKHTGYRVEIGQIAQGKCVKHEIDVLARQDHHCFIIECKYHNQPGTISDVKIPLYIHSRFNDVKEAWKLLPENKDITFQGWVVTNTKFTNDAITYGNCAGLHLLGWDYPAQNSLKNQIDNSGLYPVTCLTSLSKHEKQQLLNARIVLCREIVNKPHLLVANGIRQNRTAAILKEAQILCEEIAFQTKPKSKKI